MARPASHAARLAVQLSLSACPLLSRRSYSAATAPSGVVRRVEEKAAGASMSSKSKKTTGGAAEPSAVPWVPDPETGYYRPANRPAELDAAEMRQRLLSSNRFHR